MNNVGIFAGAFDPIHDGHLAVARSACDTLSLDRLYFLVEPKPWGNKQPVDVVFRRFMVDLAIKKDRKISQLNMDQNTFTIDETLPEIEEKLQSSELFFIFGADVFLQMNKKQWPGLEKLLKHYIVVFERKEITEKEITLHAAELGIVVAILPSEYPHHTSSNVRMQPKDKEFWVPGTVADYIKKNKLY